MRIANAGHAPCKMDKQNTTFEQALNLWLGTRRIGRKPTTKRFYEFVEKIIRQHWPDLKKPIHEVSAIDVIEFAEQTAHFSPSYWNAFVSALRYIIPHAATRDIIKRRRQRARTFMPPSQQQFEAFLRECDNNTRSHVGLVVRFLSLTGLRWGQAQSIRWEHIREDSIEVPGQKNGMPHTVPIIGALPQLLARLKQLNFDGYVLPREHPR